MNGKCTEGVIHLANMPDSQRTGLQKKSENSGLNKILLVFLLKAFIFSLLKNDTISGNFPKTLLI